MGELLAVICDSCGEPMIPNVSTLDDDGCGCNCLNPGCPELAAGELEAEDLVEAGVPEARAGRLARRGDHYADAGEARGRGANAPVRARERAQAELARLHALLLELGRLAEGAGALAAHLDEALVVSYHSDDFAEAQEAKQALIAVGALCGVIRRTSDDAQAWLAHIDSGLPGYSLPPSPEASRLAIVHPASPSSLSCAASPSGRLFA
jgi:hypothetical protein